MNTFFSDKHLREQHLHREFQNVANKKCRALTLSGRKRARLHESTAIKAFCQQFEQETVAL